MISVQQLASFLNKEQAPVDDGMEEFRFNSKKKKTLYQQYITDDHFSTMRPGVELPSILTHLFLDKTNSYFIYDDDVKTIKKNTFVYAILSLIDNDFRSFDVKKKTDLVREFFMKMASDLETKDLHKRFGYSRKKKFKKGDLQKHLTDMANYIYDVDEEDDPVIKKYIVDYYGINIFEVSHNDLTVQTSVLGSMTDVEPTEQYNKLLPSLLIYKANGKYYPLMNADKNILRFSEDQVFMERVEGYFSKKKKIRIVKKKAKEI